MKKEELKIGDTVKAIFRKYGNHIVIGEIWEISTDEHALKGDWVSLKVKDGDKKDKYVCWMIQEKINVMLSVFDVVEILVR